MNTDSVLLNDKVAIVTGGGAGIGRGIAKAFAAFGAQVALFERDPQRAARVAQEIETAGGNVLGLAVDVRDAQAVESAVEQTVNHFGGIDILVNNAGGVFAEPFMDSNEKGWDALHSANNKHIYQCSQSAAPRLHQKGSRRRPITLLPV